MPEGCTILRLSIDLVLVPDSAHIASSFDCRAHVALSFQAKRGTTFYLAITKGRAEAVFLCEPLSRQAPGVVVKSFLIASAGSRSS